MVSAVGQIKPSFTETPITVLLGDGTLAGRMPVATEKGKIVKLVGDSRYNLAAVGDPIEGFVYSVEPSPQDNASVGSVSVCDDLVYAIADGLQATPGTGVLAVGDYVVTGTVTASGTKLPLGAPRVCKATTPANLLSFRWRVVSLGTAGTGAVGTKIVIQRAE